MNRLLAPYVVPTQRRPSHAALVPGIRRAVDQWRTEDYPSATDTTKRLLRYWFQEDHKGKAGRKAQEFAYYFCQREAIETLIYLYEVRRLHSLYDLARNFPPQRPFLISPDEDRFARYVFKMATGSGKTKVMSLAIAWSYFNAIFEPNSSLPRTFLVIAPNVIVYERLKVDFADGRIFSEDPVIPPEWRGNWQVSVVLRDNPAQPSTLGAVYLTNVQRLYDAPADRATRNEQPEMTAVLGTPVRRDAAVTGQALRDLVLRHDDLMVINDEGHHLHNEDLEWHRVIVGLHERLQARGLPGLSGQLDFTATPKHQNGALFREIVVDYPIAQAVEDEIVKKPIMGELTGAIEQESGDASIKYRDRLTAGIRKWREMWDTFQETGRKPVMFVMAESTKAADDINNWLESQPDFTGHVLNIHTNRTGDIAETQSNLPLIDQLREAARQVDSDDNPYRAIVSVLMLREGWDVKNVVVIVPLRPYTARAQILPEQTLGRGLRRMTLPASGYEERVIVIEHEAFKQFWNKELEEEGLEIEWVPIDTLRPNFQAVYVVPSKLEYDIEVPLLSPALVTDPTGLSSLRLEDIPLRRQLSPPQPSLLREDTFQYRGIEMLTLEEVERQEIERDFPVDPVGYVATMCDLISRKCHLTGQFHDLAGLVKGYIESVLFGLAVDMGEEYVLIRLNKPDAKTAIFEALTQAIRDRTVRPQVVRPLAETLRFSETAGYEWSRPTYAGQKTVFNLVACDNQFEADFAAFLDRASDVAAFAKNNLSTHFTLEYQDSQGALRLYVSDFIVRLAGGDMWLVETKGQEDIEVARKDARARQWCADVTSLTSTAWAYTKVPYALFQGSGAFTFGELAAEIATLSRQE